MNLTKIQQIVNNPLVPDDFKKKLIFQVVAQDKKAISYILEILDAERKANKELILDSNVELSRALVALDDDKMKDSREFIVGEIKKHYIKWKEVIKCNFNVKGLP